MRKLHKTKRLLLNLGPLDHALLTYLSRLTNKKGAALLREGLRHLAHSSPTFNVAVFKRFVKEEWLPTLPDAAAGRLVEELELFADSGAGGDATDRTAEVEFDSSNDFG